MEHSPTHGHADRCEGSVSGWWLGVSCVLCEEREKEEGGEMLCHGGDHRNCRYLGTEFLDVEGHQFCDYPSVLERFKQERVGRLLLNSSSKRCRKNFKNLDK